MIQEELVGVIITAKLRLLRRRQREKTWQHEPDSFSVLCISTVKKTLAADSYSVLCISTVKKTLAADSYSGNSNCPIKKLPFKIPHNEMISFEK